MRVISPLDLRRSLGAILDAASAGERIVVERDRRPLAMLVSIEDGRRLEPDADEVRRRRLAALDRLEALASRVAARPATVRPARTERSSVAVVAPTATSASTPTAPAAPAPDPLPPDTASPGREPDDRDRHRTERQRHAREGLVGLG